MVVRLPRGFQWFIIFVVLGTFGPASLAQSPAQSPTPRPLSPPAKIVSPSAPAATLPSSAPPIRLYQKVLMLGRLPYINLTWMKTSHEPLMEYLQREIGVKDARLVTAKDYKGILDSLSRGTIDFAWLSAITYSRYHQQYRLIPLVKTGKGDITSYHGIFITRRDSGIKDLKDIKGKRLAFVDPESSSGYVFPLALLQKEGIDPTKDCTEVVFLKKHDEVVKQVLSRGVDVGACLEEAPVLHGKGKLPEEIFILGKSEPIPADPLVCRQDLSPVLQKKIRDALLKITSGSPLSKELLAKEFGIDCFLPASDVDYNSVKQVLKQLETR